MDFLSLTYITELLSGVILEKEKMYDPWRISVIKRCLDLGKELYI